MDLELAFLLKKKRRLVSFPRKRSSFLEPRETCGSPKRECSTYLVSWILSRSFDISIREIPRFRDNLSDDAYAFRRMGGGA